MATLVAIDPSFTASGLALLDTKQRTVATAVVSRDVLVPDFPQIAKLAMEVVDELLGLILGFGSPPFVCLHETPPADLTYSAGLWGLDVLLCHRLTTMEGCQAVYTVPNSYLQFLHGKASYPASLSTKAGLEILEMLGRHYEYVGSVRQGGKKVQGRIKNDEGVALLYLARLLVRMAPKLSRLSEGLIQDLLTFKPVLVDTKEVPTWYLRRG